MLEKNRQNSDCDYSAELISYFYDEIGAKEKSRFEFHLSKCAECTEELAEFSGVQFAVRQWRDEEFAVLQTPSIVIPYEKTAAKSVAQISSADFWLARIRRRFSIAPMWAAASTAMAILTVSGGLFFVANYTQPGEMAQIDPISVEKTESASFNNPAVENKKTATEFFAVQKADDGNSTIATTQTKASDATSAENTTVIQQANLKKSVVKNSGIKAAATNAKTSVREFSNAAAKTPANKTVAAESSAPVKVSVPTLNNYDDVEDETLRLADLFAEVDTRK